jgi:hypothetical protein
MTSASLDALKPRRKWGWLFVVVFVLQASAFTVVIGTDVTKANEWRDLAQRSLDSQDPRCAITARWAWQPSQTAPPVC